MKQTILISGAGSGIGRATALTLAQSSDTVELVLVGRQADALEATRQLLSRPASHVVVAASQADHEALHNGLRKVDLPSRNLAGVVANAGVGGENSFGPDDRWTEVINTNLSGTYYLVNECLPALKAAAAPARNVIIVSSVLARLGIPGYTAYCASKAGLLGLMRAWAAEHASKRIYFNAVCPGWVNTVMAREGIQQYADFTGRTFDDMRAAQMAMVPTGKMSEPAEIAALIAFLMSGAQTSFTGQCFDMNNGAVMP